MEKEIKKANKTKIVVIVAAILAVIALVLVGISFYFASNSKTVLMQSVKHLTNQTKDLLEDTYDQNVLNQMKKDQVGLHSNIKISMNQEELFQLKLSYLQNKTDQKASVLLDLLQNKQSLLNAEGVLDNSRLYVKVQDIMDYYYTELSSSTSSNQISIEDCQKILDFIYTSFKEEINQKDIQKSKETITLGDKKKKVTKLSYPITSKFISNIVKKASQDKEIVAIFTKISNMDEKELKASFDSIIKELEDSKTTPIYYNVYYYGFNNIVLYELGSDELLFKVYQYNKTTEIVVGSDQENVFTLKMVPNKDHYDISGKISNYSYSGTYTLKNGKETVDLDLIIEGMIINMKLTQEVENKNNYSVHTNLVIGFIGSEIEIDEVTTLSEEQVEIPTIENAKNFSAMTEQDMNTIFTNIQNHPFLSSIYEMISGFGGSIEDDSSVDLDIDSE